MEVRYWNGGESDDTAGYIYGKGPPNKSMHANCYRPFYDGYLLVKKWVIVASIANPQSRDFKRWAATAQTAMNHNRH